MNNLSSIPEDYNDTVAALLNFSRPFPRQLVRFTKSKDDVLFSYFMSEHNQKVKALQDYVYLAFALDLNPSDKRILIKIQKRMR